MNRHHILSLSVIAASGLALLPGNAVAQSAKDLVGTWTKVSDVTVLQDGSRSDSFGPNGKGLVIFESNGRFATVNANPDVPKFTSNNRAQGTPEENKAAVLGSIAYFGTYSVADKVLSYKVEGSTYPNYTGTEQKRTVISFTGDDMKWTFSPSAGQTVELTYKRTK
jgi:lipocalin-like protein